MVSDRGHIVLLFNQEENPWEVLSVLARPFKLNRIA